MRVAKDSGGALMLAGGAKCWIGMGHLCFLEAWSQVAQAGHACYRL